MNQHAGGTKVTAGAVEFSCGGDTVAVMIGILTKHWLLAIEIAVAIAFFAILVRPVADQGGGTIPAIALLFGATSIAVHRVLPGAALGALALQVLTLLVLGFGGRTPALEFWAGVPLVLFSAAFFGGRYARTLSLSFGFIAWLALTGHAVSVFLGGERERQLGATIFSALEVNAPGIVVTAMALIGPPAAGLLLRRLRSRPIPNAQPVTQTMAEFARAVSLSTREQRVFELAAQGLTNAEIAAEEHVSEATVKSHMTRVLAKVGARDRVQLAIEAHRRGLFATTP